MASYNSIILFVIWNLLDFMITNVQQQIYKINFLFFGCKSLGAQTSLPVSKSLWIQLQD